jgi:protoheme IX farnesyltransferase
MSSGVIAPPSSLVLSRQRIADYVELTKPRIAIMALVTVAIGFFVASNGPLDAALLAHTLVGTALLAAGASALNQVLERDTDALMRRTRERPLPAGRLKPTEAMIFGLLLSVVGLNYLCAFVNLLTGFLGAVTVVCYAFVYTPLKRRTSLNTLVGAIPGALPPVMGWTALRGSIDGEAWILFLIVFLWQFPHFLAIAWIYRDDYARAGLKMLPVVDSGGGMTGRQSLGYALALVPVSLAPSVIGMTGRAYFFGALGLSLAFLAFAIAFSVLATQQRARNLMRASLVYLPTLFVFMTLDLV